MSSTDTEMWVSPISFITRGRRGRVRTGFGVVHQLEDELAPAQVDGLDPDRLGEVDQLRDHLVGRLQLVPELEAEHLLVEPARPRRVGDAETHMVEHRTH